MIFFPFQVLAQESLKLSVSDAGVFDPGQGPVTVKYRLLKEATEITVLVQDFRGQVIDNLNFLNLRAKDHEFAWDGLDENELSYPDGRYRFEIRVVFKDGTIERSRVETRIANLSKEDAKSPPEISSPKKYVYKIDGSISTFYRRNTEDENLSDDGGEHRVRVHGLYKEKKSKLEGVFSLVRPYPQDHNARGNPENYEGCWAMGEQKWESGKIKGVFRQGLGNFDDPMKLFSDYRSERKKIGSRVEQDYKWLTINALGFSSESDVESEEQGMAGRIVFGPPKNWKAGTSYARRQAVHDNNTSSKSSDAIGLDFMVPVTKQMKLSAEYVRSSDTEGNKDTGYFLGGEYNKGTFRFSGKYINLGKDFEVEYADPLRGINTDARGGEVEMDYLHRKEFLSLKNIALSYRFFSIKRWSNDETIHEGDTSIRFKKGDKTDFHFNWLGKKEGDFTTNNLMGNMRYKWSEMWSSRVQGNFTKSDNSETARLLAGSTLNKKEDRYDLSFERTIRKIDGSADSPYEENTVMLVCAHGQWDLDLTGRRSKRGSEWGTNLYSRLSYKQTFLHRYGLIYYVALGKSSAFKTESQMECGVELNF